MGIWSNGLRVKIFNELGLLESIPAISFSFIRKLVGPFINLASCALQHEHYYSSQGLPLRFEVESLGCSHGQLEYKFDGFEFYLMIIVLPLQLFNYD